jgi:hypothetical protein
METKNLSENEIVKEEVENVSKDAGNLIKNELLNTVNKFVNELDIAFEYINKDKITEIRKYIEKLKDDDEELKNLVNNVLDNFKGCESKLGFLSLSNGKIKNKEFDILDNKVILGGLLNLSIFKEENKNTKKIICKYLYNMYMSSVILKFSFDDNLSLNSLNQELSNYFDVIKEQHNVTTQQNESGSGSGSNKKKSRRVKPGSGLSDMGNIEGVDDIMNSLFANKDLVNIANEFTKDIQKQNINPMMMLGSLMSGKPDKQITNLINQISGKLERKISTGELDKAVFEQQANNLMNTLKNSNITSQLPVLNTILENSDITKIK